MKILVVGGAGYIGSHMVKFLMQQACNITVLDNLSTGHADAVPAALLHKGDLADVDSLDALFTQHQFDAVMHFASFSLVGESITDPARYYRNNVSNTQNLLDTMINHGVYQFIFSSSAAIFGEPEYLPIDEEHPKNPLNPYGRSKWMVEQMLEDYDRAYGLKSISLRYFNAAGADSDGSLGERHNPETHLIPLLLQVAAGQRDNVTIFGHDYQTVDGTCIRDYIHVHDLCVAHWRALNFLQMHKQSEQFNLGNGSGFSVQQVVDACRTISGIEISTTYGNKRVGDPISLIADSKKAKRLLTWQPKYTSLHEIIAHAWCWHQQQLEHK
ncbi:UDP-glucose 4-epimerase GalE [Mariprofundus sp. EBB-1]|uniref:UDP-glucose 4-epimerase GalE n=1 Tax=Mariprofundus sp. EBB-1 TaxID=2650971 RepID=UPI000EF26C92|nr:UDP-glucose 4-epimerase GalE [Mariprofundus sp. EBB-1]